MIAGVDSWLDVRRKAYQLPDIYLVNIYGYVSKVPQYHAIGSGGPIAIDALQKGYAWEGLPHPDMGHELGLQAMERATTEDAASGGQIIAIKVKSDGKYQIAKYGTNTMENTMSDDKMNDRKVRALNENVSPLRIELDDKRVRYFQSTTATPGLPQPYGENDSLPARYFFTSSPVSRKAGEAFTPPTFGASKYRSAKTYSGTSSGNSSFSSRGRLSLSPLSSIENLEISSHMPLPMYGMPVKVDDEVIVMDDIQVRHMLGGKSGRSSSSSSGRSSSSSKSTFKTEICRSWEESGNCRYNSKCQFAHGKEELLLNRLTMKSKSETGKLSTRPGPYIYSPNSCNIAAAES